MRLVTAKQAASELYVTVGMIHYWIRTGRLEKYPYLMTPGSARARKRLYSTSRFLVDIDEAKLVPQNKSAADLKLLNSDKRLLRVSEIAKILDVREDRVRLWAKSFGLKKYYLPTSPSYYFLDGDELADNLEDAGLGYLIK